MDPKVQKCSSRDVRKGNYPKFWETPILVSHCVESYRPCIVPFSLPFDFPLLGPIGAIQSHIHFFVKPRNLFGGSKVRLRASAQAAGQRCPRVPLAPHRCPEAWGRARPAVGLRLEGLGFT